MSRDLHLPPPISRQTFGTHAQANQGIAHKATGALKVQAGLFTLSRRDPRPRVFFAEGMLAVFQRACM